MYKKVEYKLGWVFFGVAVFGLITKQPEVFYANMIMAMIAWK
jgi:hypothetical protein